MFRTSARPHPIPYFAMQVYSWSQDRNAILADEMGLGKTVQCVAFLVRFEEGKTAQCAAFTVCLGELWRSVRTLQGGDACVCGGGGVRHRHLHPTITWWCEASGSCYCIMPNDTGSASYNK